MTPSFRSCLSIKHSMSRCKRHTELFPEFGIISTFLIEVNEICGTGCRGKSKTGEDECCLRWHVSCFMFNMNVYGTNTIVLKKALRDLVGEKTFCNANNEFIFRKSIPSLPSKYKGIL